MYYLLFGDLAARTRFIDGMRSRGIGAVFHYIPLHSSPMGQRVGRTPAPLPVTDSVSDRLVRLPLWAGLEQHLDDLLAEASLALEDAAVLAPTMASAG
jgi:dTDP-4-amino-4,6-dideoxygalactose transaminase